MDVAYRFPLHKYRNEIRNIDFRIEGYFRINLETDENVETKHFTIGDDYGKSLNDLLTTIQGNNRRFGWIRFLVHMLEVGKPFSFLVRGFNAYINGVHDGRSMYEIGRPYDGNKLFVTRNFTGYGVMYRDLLGQRGEDNLVGVQIGYNSLYTISTNKGKPRSWKKSIVTFAIMYPEALRTVIRLDMEVVIRVKVKVETKAGVDMEVAVKSGQGYKACPTCNEDTPSIRVLSKTAYVGHGRFLKKPHKWRSSREFNGQTDNRDPPKEFGRDKILAQLDRLPTCLTGKHPSYRGVKIKRNVVVELNWTKRSIFYELEYWSFLTLRHNLDIMHIEKNVLEAILNTLLMNDKSKDTAKARQDLQMLGIRSGLWLSQTKNGKCLKPQAAYSFTPENRKKFCQYIKGVKLPDGFGSCFKHKVTDNDTNITGLKSHDCHIMMQRLLPYGLQNYLPDKIAKPIIDLCSLFKQICSATLMEDDMLKAQIKVVDILCELELIYPPALFDIMVHLVIHLPIEALEGGPIRPRWMYPFERYMKKLKGYVRNKAKPEGSIAEGYVAEEALTFSSHYFRDVTTKFNRPDRNVDPPPATCRFQVFRSLQEILEFKYLSFKVALFRVKWFDTRNNGRVKKLTFRNGMTQIIGSGEWWKNDQYISRIPMLKQCLLLEDPAKPISARSFELVNHKSFSTGVSYVMVNQRWLTHRHIYIDVPDEDDDIMDDEDALPHDLADSDVEDLINDDDGVEKMADVARAHGGDGGGEDPSRPPPTSFGCAGCFINRGKGKRKPNLGGRAASRLNTRDKTRNLSLKEIAETKVCRCTTPLGRRSRREGECDDISRLGPCLTSGRTWNPPAGQRSTKASTCTCKKPTIPTRLSFKGQEIGRRTPPPVDESMR
ncbi:hypothetical protein Tco_0709883 [Tanacetum coccineum]